ncbi:MAG: hypothetical protein LQ350_004031 [Teloschistes chrysophthalmus]|nr:MAG: hypothetical protein LQ350_004031 [Niorma chrysophthalma]
MMQSAVRLPTPPPLDTYPTFSNLGRKRSPPSRSPSPVRRRSPPRNFDRSAQTFKDVDPQRAMERERQLAERLRKQEPEPIKPPTEEEKQAAAKAEYEKLLNSRSGGTYIPPARLRALQAQITDKKSKEYQRMAWEALKKSINGLINKVNVSNIKHIVPELFTENLVRGRGLFCRSIMKAAASSSAFVSIYAAMAAIINTKLPQVGELLVQRLILQFKKAFKRNDKAVCLSSTTFIAHLVNQQVVHEILAAQMLLLLLNKPTDDSVEIAVGLMREVGQHLEEMSGPIALAVFDQFRSILHEQDIDKRVQYMIEVLFQVRKDKYKDNPAIREELDLVEEEDQITHRANLDDDVDVQDTLNVFKFDSEWEEHEEAYKKLKMEILGEAEGSDEEGDETGESSDDEEDKEERELEIKDQTNTDLTNLRRTIYLTIMSSLDFEEAVHKMLKINLPVGQEPELPSMIVECCSQERTYSKFYGLIGERFAKLNRLWTDLFERSFATYYETIHRYETNRLRNIARFFGHLLSSDAVGWHVLSIVHLNEEETTSSSRIFIKILFQDLAEALGMSKLQARLKDDLLHPSYDGIFPTDNPRSTRFSINYFTSIGMGALTEGMREHLKNAPKPAAIMPPKPASDSDSESSGSSYSSYSSSSRSDSRSRHTQAHGPLRQRDPVSVGGGDHGPDLHRLHHEGMVGVGVGTQALPVLLRGPVDMDGLRVGLTQGRAVPHVLLESGATRAALVRGRIHHLGIKVLGVDEADQSRDRYLAIVGGDAGQLASRGQAWLKGTTSPPSLLSQLQPSSPPLLNASNEVSSPLLAALGTYPTTESTSQPLYPGLDWIEDVPGQGSPPNPHTNGISLASSPPGIRPQARVGSGGFSNASPTRSPPAIYSKPVRHTSGYQSLGGYHGSPPSAQRPTSTHVQRSPSQNPALPHYPQAHFYGAPDVDFGLPSGHRAKQEPEAPCCCVFADLDAAGAEGFRGAETALLVGFQNRLDVFNIDKGRLHSIGRLENLRGAVVGAQLLPAPSRDDPVHTLRPLVMVVVRGSLSDNRPEAYSTSKNDSEEALFDPSASMLQALEDVGDAGETSATRCQTTVEVYSLAKGKYIATLLKSPAIDPTPTQKGSPPTVPPPNDEWQLQGFGRFLVLGSGKSGEVFIFESIYNSDETSPLAFRCIGKTWTSVSQKKKRSLSTSSTDSEFEDRSGTSPARADGAILSLSHRWLAIVPPSANTRTTTHASVELQSHGAKPPGLGSHTSPQSPQPTCDLDTPEEESLLNKVARDVTQEFMKGARWIGDQGMQAWKSYWQKPPETTDPTFARTSANTHIPPLTQNPLPPTHANDDLSPRNISQRAIVSILDLERLSANQNAKEDVALQPLAAFVLPDGCSLVSFTPSGLGLLTVSAKGDVQHVWSLMRMAHGGGPVFSADHGQVERAPNVRQIARFTRMTVARIVDVIWTEPSGERLALLTERGTVHIYNLTPSALQWPPPRRALRSTASNAQSPKPSPELAPAVPQKPPPGRLSSAMEMVTGRTQPLLAGFRGRPTSIGNPFSGFSGMSLTAGAGIKSGKVVAAGFNKSVGAATGTVSTIRHLGENRLTLPGPPHTIAPGHLRWLAGKNRGQMAVVGDDTIRIYRISHSANQKPGKRRPSVIGSKPVELSLLKAIETSARQRQQQQRTPPQTRGGGAPSSSSSSTSPYGFWLAPSSPRPRSAQRMEETMSLHSQAEIDTNAPYQPFHTDRRVNLFVYANDSNDNNNGDDEESDPHHLLDPTQPWLFGDPIPTVRTSAGLANNNDPPSDDGEDDSALQLLHAGGMERDVRIRGNGNGGEGGGQQIVITTRRRMKVTKGEAGGAGGAGAGGEEIFEDDCEVVDFADERV